MSVCVCSWVCVVQCMCVCVFCIASSKSILSFLFPHFPPPLLPLTSATCPPPTGAYLLRLKDCKETVCPSVSHSFIYYHQTTLVKKSTVSVKKSVWMIIRVSSSPSITASTQCLWHTFQENSYLLHLRHCECVCLCVCVCVCVYTMCGGLIWCWQPQWHWYCYLEWLLLQLALPLNLAEWDSQSQLSLVPDISSFFTGTSLCLGDSGCYMSSILYHSLTTFRVTLARNKALTATIQSCVIMFVFVCAYVCVFLSLCWFL